MSKKFSEVEVGESFEIEGADGIFLKVDEEWREPYCPTNAESEQLGGVWVDDNEEVEVNE